MESCRSLYGLPYRALCSRSAGSFFSIERVCIILDLLSYLLLTNLPFLSSLSLISHSLIRDLVATLQLAQLSSAHSFFSRTTLLAMKIASVATAFALVSAAFAAPAKHPHEHPTPSGWPLVPTGLPTPTGLPEYNKHHHNHKKVNFPAASGTIPIPTGSVPAPSSVDGLPLRHKSLRSVVRRDLHLMPSEDEPESLRGHGHHRHRPVPTGHIPTTGRLPVPTGLI